MKLAAIDKVTFERKAESGCSNSSYVIVRTTCCGRACVEDTELHDLYFDPQDFVKRVRLWEEAPCPLCGASNWDLASVDEDAGCPAEWAWACREM